MKKIVLLLIIILICSFAFAELKPLVNYSSNDVSSHACVPTELSCAYLNSVLIEDIYVGNSSETKIFGLSTDPTFPGTNAHLEITNDFAQGNVNTYSNYLDFGIYLTAEGESKCRFTKGLSCGVGNCIIGISDETNAHLSQCNTFGTNEIKLCCEFDKTIIVGPRTPDYGDCEINYFEAEDIFVEDDVEISYSCASATSMSLMIFDSKGNPLLTPEYTGICDITKQVYDQYSFTKSEQVAIVKIQTPNCTKEKYFAVKNKVESSIPDNNLFLVLFVVLIATVVLVKKKD